ncbi:hypothetical protein [Bacillus salipaludis]|uniref:Uncharacterized protein n=1 Tax=Bacillus salipaludis TaxID=2547811 RepID=A0AA90QXC8_9BACI|nr:hypothetical protein [Bacillus salipaludis]MDQ6600287.1 hypothetical protein [Bacillus salipaludis]
MEMVFMRSMKAKKEREFHGNGLHEVDEGEKREGVSWKWFS